MFMTKRKANRRPESHSRGGMNADELRTVCKNLTMNQARSIEQYSIEAKDFPGNSRDFGNRLIPASPYHDPAMAWAAEYLRAH